MKPNPLKGLPLFGKRYLYLWLDIPAVKMRLTGEQAARKNMNEEQTASLKTALLH